MFLLAACGTTATTGSGTASPTPTAQPPTPTPVVKLVLTNACPGPGGFGTGDDKHERVCVRTLAGATLTIHVTFCRGNVDQSDALQGTFTADQTGYYEWNWTPKATCPGNPPGATGFWQGTAEVTATLDGQTGTLSIDFLA